MTTTGRFSYLCSSLLRTSSVVLGLALCASAWANSNKNVVTTAAQADVQPAPKAKKVQVYVFTTASAIPVPIEQLSGPFPTTTRPVAITGRQTPLIR